MIDQGSSNQLKRLLPVSSSEPVKTTKNQKEILFHTNIRSLGANFDDLQLFLQILDKAPIAVCLSETWLKNCSSLDLFKFDHYRPPLFVANLNKSSGVAIYIRDDVSYEILEITKEIENITVTVPYLENKLIISCIYNSSSISKSKFINNIDLLLHKLSNRIEPSVVVGYMNLDLNVQSRLTAEYITVLSAKWIYTVD